ncbi:MAG: NAD(+) synthase [Lachnospiraceae bacterium]|nr:NAD(+) synthase [Lachnospiraceae bacterium]
MQHGFIKVAAVTPEIKVGDPFYNAEQICKGIDEAEQKGAKIIVFPELCLTGYTCQDLFMQESLLTAAKAGLKYIVDYSDGIDALIFVGLPFAKGNNLYNTAAVINCGELVGLVPKCNIPSHGEFGEGRWFAKGNAEPEIVDFDEVQIPFGANLLFESDAIPGLKIAAEICEDLWVADSPSVSHAANGASVIVNLAASTEAVGKAEHRRLLVKGASAKQICGYVFANAGEGESTQDLVFGGHNLIAEIGKITAESNRFENGILYADLDIHKICSERRRNTTLPQGTGDEYMTIPVALVHQETELEKAVPKSPFVPSDEMTRAQRCEEILTMQALGLKKRLKHIGGQKAVIGISGGLDSTLALLVVVKAFDMLGLERKDIVAVTMPCFGTTDRTYDNACTLSKTLGATLLEVDIKKAVRQHFEDIGQDENKHDVTYENAQARERTQVLMDIANRQGAIVIGTGDLSELVLGWATYNGDHMSMYGVNGDVPKTLVRHLVRYFADTCGDKGLADVLYDVLDTPVSPELLPPKEGQIAQKTEDLVGPYELHDFFLYYMLRYGFAPDKIYRIAVNAFAGEYDEEVILKWLKTFYKRFFSQQFKRSCLPDGPKVGSVGVSPRGDLRMPSDASARIWLELLEDM